MQNENSAWQAWVDTMPPTKGGTLHVTGEIYAAKVEYKLDEAESQGPNEKILLLQIYPDIEEGQDKQLLKFEKKLENSSQYDQVQIINPAVTVDIVIVS